MSLSMISLKIVVIFIVNMKIIGIMSNGLEIPRHHRDDQILNQMLSIDRYDYRLRPEAHTVVNVSITLLTLSTPDESSISYEIEFLLHLKWNDFRLKYEDGGKHQYLNALKHFDKLWVPDLYFIKHGKMPKKHDNDIIALKIFRDGNIEFTNRYEMQIICSPNLRIFPFDSVKCNFAIESKFSEFFNILINPTMNSMTERFTIGKGWTIGVTHERHQLELNWNEWQSMVNSESICITNAYLIHNSTEKCSREQSWRQDYSCLNAVLVFTRDKSYYLNIYFIPTMLLVTLTFLAFWLTSWPAAVGRILINLSSLLSVLILFINFRSNLPVVSNTTALNIWEFVSIFFISLANIEFVVHLRQSFIDTNDQYIRQRLPSKGILEEVEMRAHLCQQSMEITSIDGQQQQSHPQQTASRGHKSGADSDIFSSNGRYKKWLSLDNICKYLFPILYYIFVFIYFIIFG